MARRNWRPVFLDAFRNSGNVHASCRAAGVSRAELYRARARDDQFAAQFDDAREDAIDTLEAAAWMRARRGSDYLLWKLLQSYRRSVYGDQVAVSGQNGGPVQIVVTYEDEVAAQLDRDVMTPFERRALGA